MEHLVESHLGSFYLIKDDNKKIIKMTNEDSDRILLSWKDGKKIEVFEEYFSGVRVSKKAIKGYYKKGLSKEEVEKMVTLPYLEEELMIRKLVLSKIISMEEKDFLLVKNNKSKEEQLELFRKVSNKKRLKLIK